MTQIPSDIRERVAPLKADGFNDAIIGKRDGLWVYSTDKVIDILMDASVDMTREDAFEYFDFNIKGAYVGPGTPIFE
jgi:hypothetical protein